MLDMFKSAILLCLFLTFLLTACSGETSKPADDGTPSSVTGTVVAPLEEAYVYVYRKGMDLYGPALEVSRATGPDGSFEVALPDGDYIFVVRKRQNGESSGPVVAGDNRSEFVNVTVSGGKAELELVAPVKVGDSRQLSEQQQATQTGLSGRILDMDGKPVRDARVHVYDHVQMSERPKYVSEKTGADGRYLIHLPEGGTYYLAARDKFGGPPKLGDLYGRYDKGTIEPSAVVVKGGEILKGIDIRVAKVW